MAAISIKLRNSSIVIGYCSSKAWKTYPPGKNGSWEEIVKCFLFADKCRTAEQSEGGKVVGVDSTVITARQCLSFMAFMVSRAELIDSRRPEACGEDQEEGWWQACGSRD